MLEQIAEREDLPVSTAARNLLRSAAERRLVELETIAQARQARPQAVER
jgi:hypothetical protein